MRATRVSMATDYNVWGEYVDPAGVVDEAQFAAMSVAAKLQMIEEIFGAEADRDADGDGAGSLGEVRHDAT